jgi:hypothetical protein
MCFNYAFIAIVEAVPYIVNFEYITLVITNVGGKEAREDGSGVLLRLRTATTYKGFTILVAAQGPYSQGTDFGEGIRKKS